MFSFMVWRWRRLAGPLRATGGLAGTLVAAHSGWLVRFWLFVAGP